MLYELQKNNQTLKFECNEMKNKLMVGGDRKILQAV